MNTRRSNSSKNGSYSKAVSTPAASVAERRALREEAFLSVIWHERKRAERTEKPCLLMLIQMESQFPAEKNGEALASILSALSAATRETDVTGWYQDDCTVGVLFTEIMFEDGASIVTTVMTRVSEALRSQLSSRQFNQATVSFHLFPEEHEEEFPVMPNPSTLYPTVTEREGTRGLVQR